jgi:hypothetical protein
MGFMLPYGARDDDIDEAPNNHSRFYLRWQPVAIPGPKHEDEDVQVIDQFHNAVFPAILAIAFMHCKNVDVVDVAPNPKEAAAFRKRHGRPPVRFKTLDIGPLRRVLDSQGHAQRDGLGSAMHLCRGHFKTFTEEAPLFGKLTGTYWWEPQVRGDPERGLVDKEYRVRVAEEGVGTIFEPLDEHVELAATEQEHPGRDPDLGGRGLRAHNRTVNLLADAARQAGHTPLRPRNDDPQFDLAFYLAEVLWVVEVKSITEHNEERQLRMAFGQVARYCQAMGDAGIATKPVVAVETHPYDESWIDLCNEKGIVLIWPDVFSLALW